jgi:hypothetical protein
VIADFLIRHFATDRVRINASRFQKLAEITSRDRNTFKRRSGERRDASSAVVIVAKGVCAWL